MPQHYGATVTRLAALALPGLEAVMTIDGATDAEGFRAYVEQVLWPTLAPGASVIMDHLRAHKVAGIHERIAACGAQLSSLPPYSPALSPIEPCWSKLKTLLRTAQARTRDARDAAIQQSWPQSHRRTHAAGSVIAVMPYVNSKIALGRC